MIKVRYKCFKGLKVGAYIIKYGYYKSDVRAIKIIENSKSIWNNVEYSYRIEDNHIVIYNETTLINDTYGEDIETLEYCSEDQFKFKLFRKTKTIDFEGIPSSTVLLFSMQKLLHIVFLLVLVVHIFLCFFLVVLLQIVLMFFVVVS